MGTWVRTMISQGQSASSVRGAHGVLSRILDHAVRGGRLARNPASGVRLPRSRRTEKRHLTHAQVAALAQASGDYAALIRTLA